MSTQTPNSQDTVLHYWATAEELASAGHTTAAIHVLDALLLRGIPDALVDMQVQTRVRLAAWILAESLHPEFARRTLDAARELCNHHSVSLLLRVEVLRLLSVCARRKHNSKLAVSCVSEALLRIADAQKRAAAPAKELELAEALAKLELSRAWHAKLLESQFTDVDAATHLTLVSSEYPRLALKSHTFPIAFTLGVCHAFGHICLANAPAALLHLQQATVLFGSCPELLAAKLLVEVAFGDGNSYTSHPALDAEKAASPKSPMKKRLRSESSENAQQSSAPVDVVRRSQARRQGVTWLSDGAQHAMDLIIDLLYHRSKLASSSSTCTASQATLDGKLNHLVAAVEEQMRLLTSFAGKSSSVTHATSVPELRLLTGIKIVALTESIAMELTKLNLVPVVSKLNALCQYILLFQRHTYHFVHYAHLLAASLFSTVAAALGEDDAGPNAVCALSHLRCADQSALDIPAVLQVALVRCALWYALHQRRIRAGMSSRSASGADLIERMKTEMEGLRKRQQTQPEKWHPRLRAMFSLLAGALATVEYDYANAIEMLKSAAEGVKNAVGMGSPLLACALRLLAVAHHQAGAEEASDVALTTSTQLSSRCGEESNLMHCIHWTLSRLVVSSDTDVKQRDQLQRAASSAAEHLQIHLQHALEAEEFRGVASFTPETNAAYAQWLQHTTTMTSTATATAGGIPADSPRHA